MALKMDEELINFFAKMSMKDTGKMGKDMAKEGIIQNQIYMEQWRNVYWRLGLGQYARRRITFYF